MGFHNISFDPGPTPGQACAQDEATEPRLVPSSMTKPTKRPVLLAPNGQVLRRWPRRRVE